MTETVKKILGNVSSALISVVLWAGSPLKAELAVIGDVPDSKRAPFSWIVDGVYQTDPDLCFHSKRVNNWDGPGMYQAGGLF